MLLHWCRNVFEFVLIYCAAFNSTPRVYPPAYGTAVAAAFQLHSAVPLSGATPVSYTDQSDREVFIELLQDESADQWCDAGLTEVQ